MATKRKKESQGATGGSPALSEAEGSASASPEHGKPSPLLDTRVIYCGDNLVQLAKLPDACVDLIYIDPPFNSNREAVEEARRILGSPEAVQ